MTQRAAVWVHGAVAPVGLLSVASVAVHVLSLETFCQWDRSLMLAGEIWRSLTAHVSHFGSTHLLQNLAGLLLLLVLPSPRGCGWWWRTCGICALTVSAGLLLEPGSLSHYRGLSGLTYGLWIAAALHLRSSQSDADLIVHIARGCVPLCLLVLLALDLLADTPRLIDGAAVHAHAHVYGIVGGWLAAMTATHEQNPSTPPTAPLGG